MSATDTETIRWKMSSSSTGSNFILVLGAMLFLNASDPAPKGVIAFFLIAAAVIAVAVVYVLKQRIDEVKADKLELDIPGKEIFYEKR